MTTHQCPTAAGRPDSLVRLDGAWLADAGLETLPPAIANDLLQHAYETLELRVGMVLAERFTDEQLDEFEVFLDAGDASGALAWLKANHPDYQQVVHAEVARLTAELREAAHRLLAAVENAGGR